MTLKNIVELLKNKRYRALTILVLYIIFFAIIGVMCRSLPPKSSDTNNTKVEQTLSAEDKFKQMTNYEFTYTNIKDGQESIVHGKVYRNIYLLNIDNEEYYAVNRDNVYQLGEKNKKVNIDGNIFISPSDILNYISVGTLSSKNEDYTSGTISYMYLVTNSIFGVTDSKYESNITVYKTDDNITKIIIDTTQYEQSIGNSVNNSQIIFEYQNINGVSNFTSSFDESKIVEE